MRTEAYRKHLQEQGMTVDEIEKRQMIIADFIIMPSAIFTKPTQS
jgi:hypothetical protein